MPASLKACLPILAKVLGDTPGALYSRQRAFVRGGLLKSLPGRGPGSGVHASAESIASFLIGMATNASVAENAPFAKAIARSQIMVRSECGLTRAKTFRDAFARLLVDDALAKRVFEISFLVSNGQAMIQYGDGPLKVGPPEMGTTVKKNMNRSLFMFPQPPTSAFHQTVTIDQMMVRNLASTSIELLSDQGASS